MHTLLRHIARYVAVVVLLAGSVGYGYLCSERRLPGYTVLRSVHLWAQQQPPLRKVYNAVTGRKRHPGLGPWRKIERRTAAHVVDADRRDTEATLRTLGYLSGYKTRPEAVAVTLNERARASPGYNLYTSGDAPRAVLMDMDGEILHTWSCAFADAFPETTPPETPSSWKWWSCVHPYENGDLIAVFDGFGLIKLDSQSHLIWAVPGEFHHDLFVDAKGRIFALTRQERIVPRINKVEPVTEDFIVVLDASGRMISEFSVLESFENSSYAPMLTAMPHRGDLLHTNTIEVLDGSHDDLSPAFRDGNILISSATTNIVAVIDAATQSVAWALAGQWVRQHRPTLLDNGHLLLIDNLGLKDRSRVLEVNPLTQSILWCYEGTEESPFFTETFGTLQRLPNGDTLINESNSGRAFEVAADKEVVWEFFNPARAGTEHELIATLFEFQRLPLDFFTEWPPPIR